MAFESRAGYDHAVDRDHSFFGVRHRRLGGWNRGERERPACERVPGVLNVVEASEDVERAIGR